MVATICRHRQGSSSAAIVNRILRVFAGGEGDYKGFETAAVAAEVDRPEDEDAEEIGRADEEEEEEDV